MRWSERIREPKYKVPYKTKFLFIPKCLNGQYRWLEMVDIQIEWVDYGDYLFDKEIKFLNENRILQDLYFVFKEKINHLKKK